MARPRRFELLTPQIRNLWGSRARTGESILKPRGKARIRFHRTIAPWPLIVTVRFARHRAQEFPKRVTPPSARICLAVSCGSMLIGETAWSTTTRAAVAPTKRKCATCPPSIKSRGTLPFV